MTAAGNTLESADTFSSGQNRDVGMKPAGLLQHEERSFRPESGLPFERLRAGRMTAAGKTIGAPFDCAQGKPFEWLRAGRITAFSGASG